MDSEFPDSPEKPEALGAPDAPQRPRPKVRLPGKYFDASGKPNRNWLFVTMETKVVGCSLVCLGSPLDFSDCEITLRLFKAFCLRGGSASLHELIWLVYGIRDIGDGSKRYQRSVRARLIKLISRARNRLIDYYTETLGPDFIWLDFDREHKEWVLCKERPDDPLKELLN